MKNEFGRIISKLRKQKGLSQKNAAAELGISQALLSHYEKGIRECGLEFLVKAADYYDVTTDYLLGRTTAPVVNGNEADAIPEIEDLHDVNNAKSNTYCLLNRKLLVNTTAVIYSILARIGNKKLSKSVTDYLTVSEYNMLRKIYSINESSPDDFFGLKSEYFDTFCGASLTLLSARIDDIGKNVEGLSLSKKELAETYDDSYTSLHQVVLNAEKALGQSIKI